jgi:UDP-N-acetyl-D-mannosaminuronic acid transferase (WecB/TagA/CpsF family)
MTKENILNAAFLGWTWLQLTEVVTFVLGAVGAVTLIWMNVERALRARKARKNLEQ